MEGDNAEELAAAKTKIFESLPKDGRLSCPLPWCKYTKTCEGSGKTVSADAVGNARRRVFAHAQKHFALFSCECGQLFTDTDNLRIHRSPGARDKNEPCPLSRSFFTPEVRRKMKRFSYLVDMDTCAKGMVASFFEEEFGVTPRRPLPCPVRGKDGLLVVGHYSGSSDEDSGSSSDGEESSGSESDSSSSVTRSPSRTDDVEDGGDEPVASTSSAILSYTVVDESVPDRVVPGTSTSSVGGGAEPSNDSPLRGVNVDDVELSEIMRHIESPMPQTPNPNPDNSASVNVYSPTGGEGNHVPKVGVALPLPTTSVEEETLPSGLSREGITEWVRLRRIDLEIKKLRWQIRLAELLGEKYASYTKYL